VVERSDPEVRAGRPDRLARGNDRVAAAARWAAHPDIPIYDVD
jgi:hypothetical protein